MPYSYEMIYMGAACNTISSMQYFDITLTGTFCTVQYSIFVKPNPFVYTPLQTAIASKVTSRR